MLMDDAWGDKLNDWGDELLLLRDGDDDKGNGWWEEKS